MGRREGDREEERRKGRKGVRKIRREGEPELYFFLGG